TRAPKPAPPRAGAHPAAAARSDRPAADETAPLAASGGASWRARLVAVSPAMRAVAETLERLRSSEAPVLIRGETGSGKELIARIIHEECPRRERPLHLIDLAGLAPGLIELELFGARAGAFTDLRQDRLGLLAAADGGTALLDEVGALPLEAQAKLLRVLVDGALRPLGAESTGRVDIRYLFTTACDLDEDVRAGRFRRDLFHRLDVLRVEVPPLRRRLEDLPDLVRRFLEEDVSAGTAASPLRVDPEVISLLGARPWPGNVRELRNFVCRSILEGGGRLDVETVMKLLAPPETTAGFPRGLFARESLSALKRRLEREYLLHHVRRLHGDPRALGELLRLKRRQLYRLLGRAGVSLREARRSPP
ncbi:MAG: sigma-54-dependent Fis family transcriptional regulator, partial [Planctomycetes bacterium]|nr:sigma-54-dependent Fis family transcriptional regulator [Planctomycetota bacterium]